MSKPALKLLLQQTLLALGLGIALPAALSQTNAPDSMKEAENFDLEHTPTRTLNKISLAYRMGLNITVDFRQLGGIAPIGNPGPNSPGAFNRTYDDGSYNKVDISGNAGGQTWYWGYQNANQIQGNSIVMESTSSPNDAVSPGHQNDPQHGLELSYMRELYRDKHYRFGLEAAFGWTTIDVNDSATVATTVNRITDTYAFPGGVNVIPGAPYNGTFQGPGPLLDASLGGAADPTHRTTSSVAEDALASGTRKFNSDLYMFRLGPYIEVPIYKRLSFTLGGGLSLIIGDSTFSYDETVKVLDTGFMYPTRSSSGSHTDFLVGGYVEGELNYAITDRIGVFTGVQFQTSGKSVTDSGTVNGQPVTDKRSVLDLNESVLVLFGVSYSF